MRNPDVSNYMNAHLQHAKSAARGYQHRKKKSYHYSETPRELALTETFYKVRQR